MTRALFHRLLMQGLPALRYIGGVAGHRESAVALLKSGFWTGVIPGGADEALVGHADCYRVRWPESRKGFARVAMEAGVPLVPFFVRNVEESRWNPLHELWHRCHGWVPFEWITRARIPVLSSAAYTFGIVVWFMTAWVAIPVPVRCTTIFGRPVAYRADEPVEAVVARCEAALQSLIDANQPNAAQGRNYARALGERWVEWRAAKPALCKTVENATPAFVMRRLQRWASGGKKLR